MKNISLIYFYCAFICPFINAEEEKIFIGPYVSSLSKELTELKQINDKDLCQKIKKGFQNSTRIEQADHSTMTMGWLLVIKSSDGIKVFSGFDKTRPQNVVFACKAKEEDKKYLIERFSKDFVGIKLEFDTNLLTEIAGEAN